MDRIKWLNTMSIGKVLEIGCYDGFVFRANDRIEWYGIDNWYDIFQPRAGYKPDGTKVIDDIPKWQAETLAKCREQLKGRNFIEASAESLPFKDEYFDTVVLAEVLEHVLDPNIVLAEALRVLKYNGRLLITIPAEDRWVEELQPYTHSGHTHVFSEEEVRRLVSSLNMPIKLFVITEPSWNNKFVFYYIILQKAKGEKFNVGR